MSTFPMLPRTTEFVPADKLDRVDKPDRAEKLERVEVGHVKSQAYNLVVLVRERNPGTTARAANLAIPVVEATTVREALSMLVQHARKLIVEQISMGNEIPWIQPPQEATDAESSFMVPMHL